MCLNMSEFLIIDIVLNIYHTIHSARLLYKVIYLNLCCVLNIIVGNTPLSPPEKTYPPLHRATPVKMNVDLPPHFLVNSPLRFEKNPNPPEKSFFPGTYFFSF